MIESRSAIMDPRLWTSVNGTEQTLKLFLAHLVIAERCNQWMYRAGTRQLAELSGLTVNTVTAHNKILHAQDWIRRIDGPRSLRANAYRLDLRRVRTRIATVGRREPTVSFRVPQSLDAFMHGLGLSLFVWTCLSVEAPRTVDEMSALTDKSPRYARTQLARLKEAGLARELPDGWFATGLPTALVGVVRGGRRKRDERGQRWRHEQLMWRKGYLHHLLRQPVYGSLSWHRGRSVTDIAHRTGLHPSMIRDHLVILRAEGMAVHDEHCIHWRRSTRRRERRLPL